MTKNLMKSIKKNEKKKLVKKNEKKKLVKKNEKKKVKKSKKEFPIPTPKPKNGAKCPFQPTSLPDFWERTVVPHFVFY